MSKPFRGVFAVLSTPVDESLMVDWDGLFSAIELVPTGGGLIGDHPIVGK
jgi:dihydrodipicolinate synthase/N-acetylneuraminate lyase